MTHMDSHNVIFGIVLGIFVLAGCCFIGIVCVVVNFVCHLPIFGILAGLLGFNYMGRNESRGERGTSSSRGQTAGAGYSMVRPSEVRGGDADTYYAESEFAGHENLEYQIAEAYLVPPLASAPPQSQSSSYEMAGLASSKNVAAAQTPLLLSSEYNPITGGEVVPAQLVQANNPISHPQPSAPSAPPSHSSHAHGFADPEAPPLTNTSTNGGGGEGADSPPAHVMGMLDVGLFRDLIFAAIFILQAGFLIFQAITSISLYMDMDMDESEGSTTTTTTGSNKGDGEGGFNVGRAATYLGAYLTIIAFSTAVTCTLYLTLLVRHSETIINGILVASITLFSVVAVLGFLSGAFLISIVSAVLACVNYWWYKKAQERIAFASAVLKAAVSAVQSHFCALVSSALFVLLLQMVYVLAWGVSMASIYVWFHQPAEAVPIVPSSYHGPNTYTHTRGGSGGVGSVARILLGAFNSNMNGNNDSGQYPDNDGGGPFTYDNNGAHYPGDTADNNNNYNNKNNNNNNTDDDDGSEDDGFTVVVILMLLSLYWGIEVFKNVISTTTCGTIASWWFTPTRSAAVGGALFRSLTTSFGSVCFGSLIVSVLRLLHMLVKRGRQRMEARARAANGMMNGAGARGSTSCLFSIFSLILASLESAVKYFNKYAFVYCAAYGTNFMTSGKRVMELFKKRGWDALIQDDIIGTVLGFGAVAVAIVTALFSFIMAQGLAFRPHTVLGEQDSAAGWSVGVITLGGLIMGLAVGMLVGNIINSAVACVFVYFAEDPLSLLASHPPIYEQLSSTWVAIHPTTLVFLREESSSMSSSMSMNMSHSGCSSSSDLDAVDAVDATPAAAGTTGPIISAVPVPVASVV